MLVGRSVRIRPGHPDDAPRLQAILAEPSVSRWWGEPAPVAAIETDLRGGDSAVLLVMEIDGKVAGGIQYEEENEPMYRHAGIDICLGDRFQGQGAGTEAVGLLARFLFEPGDVVIVVGQDGLVANVAKYLDGQPVIGINKYRVADGDDGGHRGQPRRPGRVAPAAEPEPGRLRQPAR